MSARGRKTKRDRKGACSCTGHSGEPKTLFSERWKASKRAGMFFSSEGRMWRTYKCPETGGWHIASVKVDPWAEVG